MLRVAVISDIHGNLTAFRAVLRDLRLVAPDAVVHAGDLADSGSSPAEVVDQIRQLGWAGALGNTDEMLFRPESFRTFAALHPALSDMLSLVSEMAAFTREALGQERLAWLEALPLTHITESLAVVHASPGDPWRAPAATASDSELQSVFAPLARPVVVYAHTHKAFVRGLGGFTLANAGSVGLPYDGDPRASYALVDGSRVAVRRVEYDVKEELARLNASRLPHASWVGRLLQTASFQMP